MLIVRGKDRNRKVHCNCETAEKRQIENFARYQNFQFDFSAALLMESLWSLRLFDKLNDGRLCDQQSKYKKNSCLMRRPEIVKHIKSVINEAAPTAKAAHRTYRVASALSCSLLYSGAAIIGIWRREGNWSRKPYCYDLLIRSAGYINVFHI